MAEERLRGEKIGRNTRAITKTREPSLQMNRRGSQLSNTTDYSAEVDASICKFVEPVGYLTNYRSQELPV